VFNTFSIILVVALIAFAVTVEVMIRKGKLKRPQTYSYKAVIQEGLRWCLFALIICLLIFVFSNSLEASLTVGIFLLFCILSGCIKSLFVERQISRRGGRREKSGRKE
jgi:Kef-type K+ transport system membrane component KefB